MALTLFTQADAMLRPRAVPTDRRLMLLAQIVLFGALYGALMGTFFGQGYPPRLWQSIYSAIKVPLLLMLTSLLALPSFYVMNMLMGLAGDFGKAIRALMATQAGLTVILASLSPFTVLFYASTTNYNAAILFNAVMFGTASVAAQRLLRRFYAPLIARNPRHRIMVRLWIIVYAFIGIQMGWVLRPFIGQPGSRTAFFREGAWGNAYIEVWDKGADVLGASRRR